MALRWWFLVPGLAVIILGFIGIVGIDIEWTRMHWLTLVVALLVFLVDFVCVTVTWSGKRESFDRFIPAIGVLGFAITSYTVLAILGLIGAWLIPVSLLSAIAFQLAILTLLIAAVQFSRFAGAHVVEVNKNESRALKNIEALRAETRQAGVRIASLATVLPETQKDWARIEEDVRYMAPIDSESAVSLEIQMLELVRRIGFMVHRSPSGVPSADAEGVGNLVAELKELLRLRKGMLTASDSSEHEV